MTDEQLLDYVDCIFSPSRVSVDVGYRGGWYSKKFRRQLSNRAEAVLDEAVEKGFITVEGKGLRKTYRHIPRKIAKRLLKK